MSPSESSHWCDVVLAASSYWKRRVRGIDFYALTASCSLNVDDNGFISFRSGLGKCYLL
ncbi:hypothetical protein SynPROS71_02744 [Synechococcus sp. PROS-7-1]|nr:hypothetical protein SynPROS71_02744 [Synechococcus sp. PROS-7-1]